MQPGGRPSEVCVPPPVLPRPSFSAQGIPCADGIYLTPVMPIATQDRNAPEVPTARRLRFSESAHGHCCCGRLLAVLSRRSAGTSEQAMPQQLPRKHLGCGGFNRLVVRDGKDGQEVKIRACPACIPRAEFIALPTESKPHLIVSSVAGISNYTRPRYLM